MLISQNYPSLLLNYKLMKFMNENILKINRNVLKKLNEVNLRKKNEIFSYFKFLEFKILLS